MAPPPPSSFRTGDLLIAQHPTPTASETAIAIVDAINHQLIAGPYAAWADAAAAGRELARARGVSLWQQAIDERGRPLGAVSQLVVREYATSNTTRLPLEDFCVAQDGTER